MSPQQELARQMSIHSGGEKMNTSSESKQSLGGAGHLKAHMEANSKVRINACVQCQRSFGQAGDLKRHMLTHRGVKAHTCSECEKSFGRAGTLRMHMITPPKKGHMFVSNARSHLVEQEI